jgi:hypothetical protein
MPQESEFPDLPAGEQVIRKFQFNKQARTLPADRPLVAAELVITVVNGDGKLQEIALPAVNFNRFRKSTPNDAAVSPADAP